MTANVFFFMLSTNLIQIELVVNSGKGGTFQQFVVRKRFLFSL